MLAAGMIGAVAALLAMALITSCLWMRKPPRHPELQEQVQDTVSELQHAPVQRQASFKEDGQSQLSSSLSRALSLSELAAIIKGGALSKKLFFCLVWCYTPFSHD